MMTGKRRRSASPDPSSGSNGGAASSSKARLMLGVAAVAALHAAKGSTGAVVPEGCTAMPTRIDIPSHFRVRQSKYERRLRRTKRDARSELDVNDWSRLNYAKLNFWIEPSRDKAPRCDYQTCSKELFITLYERPAIPAVITGATDDWPARTEWLPEKLLEHYYGEKFKIGEDDDGDSVYMQFSHFIQYSLSSGDADRDDSPLYIFDSVFGDRTRNNSAKRIARKKDEKRDKDGEDQKKKPSQAADGNDRDDDSRTADGDDVEEQDRGSRENSRVPDSYGSDDDGDVDEGPENPVEGDRKRMKWDVKLDDSGKDVSASPTQSDMTVTGDERRDKHYKEPRIFEGPNLATPMAIDLEKKTALGLGVRQKPDPMDEKITITLPTISSSSRQPQRPESRPTKDLLKDYAVPKYFTDDLFQYSGSRRPPYRWVVIGPARSGTGIHVDPLGTSAWNALVHGHKRWALFPPEVPRQFVTARGLPDYEAATWFALVYPRFFDESTRHADGTLLADRLGMLEILQRPGETVYVPGGWHHVVINLDFTVAITQNFCSRTNFEHVWLRTRHSRPGLAKKLIRRFTDFAESPTLPSAHIFADLIEKAKTLDTVPACQPSSTSSSSSSSSSSDDTVGGTDDNTASESSDEEGRCMCRKCKIRRKKRVATGVGGDKVIAAQFEAGAAASPMETGAM
ncbi:jumonji domain-containing protein 6 [Dinochytrium kinnereticum]|nr:jumonji domain-containing protein 6 [Dinochytrium kinnereticum]